MNYNYSYISGTQYWTGNNDTGTAVSASNAQIYGLEGDDSFAITQVWSLFQYSTFHGGDGNDSLILPDYTTVGIGNGSGFDGGSGTDYFEAVFSFVPLTLTHQSSDVIRLYFNNYEFFTLSGVESLNITGGSAADYLTGGTGNDYFNGGTGTDYYYDSLGDDTYVIDTSAERVWISNNSWVQQGGTDTLRISVNVDLGTWTANMAKIENVVMTGVAEIATGNSLDNRITGNGVANTIDGGAGADTMLGGLGDDLYFVDDAGDKVKENASEGTDTVNSSITFDLGADVENLTLTGKDSIFGSGNALDNIIIGNSNINKLTGGAGNDQISGGAGSDRLIGGLGSDILTGGAGGDWFVYKNVYDYSDEGVDNIDRITDFNKAQGDRIDLVNIDGNSVKGGYQRFDFIGTSAFSGKAGELRYEKGAALTTVMIDTNGDGQSDLTIQLDGSHNVTMDYFVI